MVYLVESELPKHKSVIFALTKIFGLGLKNSNMLAKKVGLTKNFKIKHLSKDQILQLSFVLETSSLKLGNELQKVKMINKKNLVSIKTFRGLRSWKGLPVRGQRTHTNAKTARKIR